MHVVNNININEYQKCGEILVATKRNTLAMVCNICQQMFIQLQAFMRHLQFQHNDKLKFIKQTKEVEVYDVEELMSQSVASIGPGIESDDSTLAEEDLKCLIKKEKTCVEKESVPNEKQTHDKERNCGDKKDGSTKCNMSILKALEDCDISLNLIDDLNSTKCSEDENNLGNALLRQIQKDWDDSDSDESNSDVSIYNDAKIMNWSKNLVEFDKQLESDADMAELNLNSTPLEEILNATTEKLENSPIKCIKNLLHGLEDLDDVDSLLENLESNVSVIERICDNSLSPVCNFNSNGDSNDCLDTKLEEKVTNINQDMSKNIDIEYNSLEDFEARLKELEEALDKDITNCNYANKNTKFKAAIENSQETSYKQSNIAQKCSESLNDEKHNPQNISISNKQVNPDFEPLVRNSNGSLLKKTNTLVINKDMETDIQFNDDLTKALADALGGEDLELLNIQPENEMEELLNREVMNLLKKPKIEIETDLKIPSPEDKHTLGPSIKRSKAVKILKKQPNDNSNNMVSKYRKTNLKAREKCIEKQHTKLLKPYKSLVLRESNSSICYSAKHRKGSPTPSQKTPEKENVEKPVPLTNYLNSHSKTFEHNKGKVLDKFEQRITPTKEYRENINSLSIGNIKKEKSVPLINFINTSRGDKTPIKRDQIFSLDSPKSKEGHDNLLKRVSPKLERGTAKDNLIKNVTSKHKGGTPEDGRIKESPKTQVKQQNINRKHSPPQTPQPKHKEGCKNPSKISPLIDKTPITTKSYNSIICKEQKGKSPGKHLTNVKLPSPTQTNSHSLHSDTTIPLTTPKRLRNVSIKLHRLTPDKLTRQFKSQETKACPTNPQYMNTKQGANYFKIPEDLRLQTLPKLESSPEPQHTEIVETPVKTNYCKQNFTEASLKIAEDEVEEQRIPIEAKSSHLQAQNKIVTKTKPGEKVLKTRERMASIDIVASNPDNGKKDYIHKSTKKSPQKNNLNYKSYAINRSARKKEILQRMHNIRKQIFKSIEEDKYATKVNDVKSLQKSQEFLVENVKILPKLTEEAMLPLLFDSCKISQNDFITPTTKSVSPKNLADDRKQAKNSLGTAQLNSSINEVENVTKKSLKRPTKSPLLNKNKQAKRQHKSPAKEEVKNTEKTSELEATQLGLSESVVEFLQRDLKATRLNVESFLNGDLPGDNCTPEKTSTEPRAKDEIIEKTVKEENLKDCSVVNDIFEQVVDKDRSAEEKMQKENPTHKLETLTTANNVEDFDNTKDLALVAKFGLNILKVPNIENDLSLEECEEMHKKATKFANIYKFYSRIWSARNSGALTCKQDLDKSFKQLLTDAKQSFNLDLSIAELKRLVNLLNAWYTENFCNKLIEKRKLSDSTLRYLLMFNYIPKTNKRLSYCEYCEEYFTTENKYYIHRIVHTGAIYPYKCQKCSRGFNTTRSMKRHKHVCDSRSQETKSPNDSEKSNSSRLKCLVCAKFFLTSELLYEHSKTHLKTIYNCVKCKLVFASAIDVQNHMAMCNTVTKCMPKQCTPRPLKQKSQKKE